MGHWCMLPLRNNMTRIQFSQDFSYQHINTLALGCPIQETLSSGLSIDVDDEDVDVILLILDTAGYKRKWTQGLWFITKGNT